MDEKDADYIIHQTAASQTQYCFLKKTLQLLVPISIISFLVSYFSVFPIIFQQLHFYSSIYPFLAQALDRKCMFLLCNGILAFLANILKRLNTSAGGFINDHGDGVEHLLPFEKVQEQQDDAVPEETVSEDDDEEESAGVEDCISEIRVSTEELNKKFEEFIRRIKEEIRIEAREQYMILV